MPHVVVVGAGVFGAWTAHHLRAAGAQVTLIDAYGPANPRASSGDQSRILRCGYGADEIYSDLARRSLDQWRALEERSGGIALASVRGAAAGGGRRPVLRRDADRRSSEGGLCCSRCSTRRAFARAIRTSTPATSRWHCSSQSAACSWRGVPCARWSGAGAVRDRVSPRAGRVVPHRRVRLTLGAPGRRRRRAGRRLRVCLRSMAAVGVSARRSAVASVRRVRPSIYFGDAGRRRSLRAGAHASVDRSSGGHLRHPRPGGLRRESRASTSMARRSIRTPTIGRPERRRNRPRPRVGRAAVPGDEGCARRRRHASASTRTPRTAIS